MGSIDKRKVLVLSSPDKSAAFPRLRIQPTRLTMRHATVTQRETRLCICTTFRVCLRTFDDDCATKRRDGVTVGITQRSFPKRETRPPSSYPDCGYYLKDRRNRDGKSRLQNRLTNIGRHVSTVPPRCYRRHRYDTQHVDMLI